MRGRFALVGIGLLILLAVSIRIVVDRRTPPTAPTTPVADDSTVAIPTSPPPLPGDNLQQMHDVDIQVNLRRSADTPQIRLQAAEMSTGIGDLWRAESLLRSVLTQSPKDRLARLRLADNLNQQVRLKEARAIAEQLNREDPRDLAPYLTLQSIAEKDKKPAEAWKWLEKALNSAAQTPENMIALAHRYYSLNDIAAARKALERGAAISPTDVNVKLQTAILEYQQSHLEESRTVLESILQANPDVEPAQRLLAGILINPGYKRQDLSRANALLERAVALDRKDENVYRQAAMVYTRMKLYRMASEAYVAFLMIEPRSPSVRYGLGQTYSRLSKNELAQEQFKLYKIVVDRDELIASLSSSVSQKPLSAQAHAALAAGLEQGGDYAGALRELQTAYGLAPNDRAITGQIKQLYLRLNWPWQDRQIK